MRISSSVFRYATSALWIDRTVFAALSHNIESVFVFDIPIFLIVQALTSLWYFIYIFIDAMILLINTYIASVQTLLFFCIFLSLCIDFLYDLSRLLDWFLKSKMYEFEPLRRYNLAPMAYTWHKTSILDRRWTMLPTICPNEFQIGCRDSVIYAVFRIKLDKKTSPQVIAETYI